MQLCNKRCEQLSSNQRDRVPGMRQVQGKAYEEEQEQPQKSVFSFIGEKFKSVVSSSPTEGVIGTMVDEHPDTNGEWLTDVQIDDTKTMTNPVDSSLNYTVITNNEYLYSTKY